MAAYAQFPIRHLPAHLGRFLRYILFRFQSKLPGYILPAIPPIGLLLARSYDCFVDCPARAFRRIQCVGGVVSLLVAFELWTIPFSASRIHAHGATGAGWVLSLLGLANLILAIPPKKPFSGLVIPQMCVLPVMIVVLLFRPLAADFLPRDPSGKSLATEIQKIQRAGAAPDLDYYVARMKRGQQFSLSFYLHREIQDSESVHPADGFVILPSNHCEPPVTPPWSCSRNALELDSTAWFVFRVQKPANYDSLLVALLWDSLRPLNRLSCLQRRAAVRH